MSVYNRCSTQDELILQNLKEFYKNKDHLKKMISIVNGESNISLRIVDWFVTNYAKNISLYMILRIQMEKLSVLRYMIIN